MFLLPFEPRRPALSVAGLALTWLELAASAGLLALAWTSRDRLGKLVRRPTLPLVLLASYAAAHVVSALLAPVNRTLALKFALRMTVMAGCALLVAAARPSARRSGLLALCASTALVAALALAEGVGVRSLDPFLNLFREMPFNVGGSRRASAGSEYPNLAAAFLMYGLLAGVALASSSRQQSTALGGACGLLGAAGLLFTYSRGALAASAIGLLCLVLALWPRSPAAARAPLVALLALCAASAVFAWRGEIFRLRLASEGTGAWYAASYAPERRELQLLPGERRTLRVRVTNTGRKTWAITELFHLSYHWYDGEGRFVADGARTQLPRDVRGGESVELDAVLLAPPQAGRYLLAWDMVHERTTWFSGQGVVPATLSVSVGEAAPAAPVPAVPPMPAALLVWRPSRADLWRAALDLWRERPLTGVGSDNFRWLHGPKAGRPFWDSRVFANNTLLEAAATTGSLGLIALGGSLVAAAASALRRVRASQPLSLPGSEAAALLGLTTAIAAHGVVDYVLAFTGHYLLFGFVLGLASAPEGA